MSSLKIKIKIRILLFLLPISLLAENSPVKCGFLSPEHGLRRATEPLLILQQAYITPAGHFTVFYDTSGYNAPDLTDRDANGIPDLVEIAGNYAERAWNLMIDTMGFRMPFKSDGTVVTNYPIYIRNLGSSLYGQTIFVGNDIPTIPGVNYESYIELNSSYSFATHLSTDPFKRDSMGMAVTISHEFFHAVQLAYNVRFGTGDQFDDLWWIEASAVFFEEELTPQINDYFNYLGDYFNSVDQSIYEQSGNRIYGEVVIPLMLKKMFGRNIIKSIWEKSIQAPAIELIGAQLREIGVTWASFLGRIGRWLMAAGYMNLFSNEYTDLAQWPVFDAYIPNLAKTSDTIRFSTRHDYSIQITEPQNYPNELTAIFPSLQDNQRLFYATEDFNQTNVTHLPVFDHITTSENNPLKIGWAVGEIQSPPTQAEIMMSYSYQTTNQPQVYPNPLRRQNSKWLVIEGGNPGDMFTLYSLNGLKIISKRFDSEEMVLGQEDWSHLLRAGVYIYVISGRQKETGKLIVI